MDILDKINNLTVNEKLKMKKSDALKAKKMVTSLFDSKRAEELDKLMNNMFYRNDSWINQSIKILDSVKGKPEFGAPSKIGNVSGKLKTLQKIADKFYEEWDGIGYDIEQINAWEYKGGFKETGKNSKEWAKKGK